MGESAVARHPDEAVEVDRGTRLSADGFTALLAGKVDCVSFAREMFPAEVAAYEAHYRLRPVPVPVAAGSYATLHATDAIAIYLNAANPLASLSLDQLERIFADADGAPTRWGQLGLSGRWAQRPVHVYGMQPYRASGNPPGIVNFLRRRLLHNKEFRRDLRIAGAEGGESALHAIVRLVAADPGGIGYSGFGFAMPGAKTIAVAAAAGAAAVAGDARSVADRSYPLGRTVYLLLSPRALSRPPGRGFAAFALGIAGQALVPKDAEHFIALTASERSRARVLLDRAPIASAAAALTRTLAPYVAAAVSAPTQANYLTPSGAVAIIGYNDMRAALAAIDTLFMAAHPGIRFALTLQGTRTAPPALMSGASLFGPMGAPFEDAPLAAYRRRLGADPLSIRVAHAAIDPAARSSPLGRVRIRRTTRSSR